MIPGVLFSRKIMSSDNNRFCSKCGAALQADTVYCPKCGTAVSQKSGSTMAPVTGTQQLDWREQRRQMRAQRRADRPGPRIGGLVIATILIVAGLAIFFPTLPWQVFWGALLIILGCWVAYLWTARSRSQAPEQKNAMTR
jgi:ribosomal protein S27AE